MNNKSFIHKITILLLVILIGLNNSRVVSAQTIDGVTSLNEKNTAIHNKYGITGEILKIQKKSDSMVILTKDGIFYIHDGKTQKYTFDGTIMDTATFNISGQNIYVSPIMKMDTSNNEIYVEFRLNLHSGSKEISTNYSEARNKFNSKGKPNSISTFTDACNNRWFSLFYDSYPQYYELFRIDSKGNVKEMENSSGSSSVFRAYDNLSCDTDKNVYFSYSVGNGIEIYGDGKGNKSKIFSGLIKVDKNLKQTSLNIYGALDDYEVGPTGDIWILSGKKTLIHFDKKGKKLATIALTNGKDITIDPNGSIYVLDDNTVKLVYKDKLYTKYTLNSTYDALNMTGKNSFIAIAENAFEMMNGDSKEVIISDAAVKYDPYVVKDNKGTITILSKNINTQSDTDLKVYQIGSSGITFHNIIADLGNYKKALGYDSTIYIPHTDNYDTTINLLKSDMSIEKFITVYTAFPLIEMQMDSKKNLYLLTSGNLFKISPAKKVQAVDVIDKIGGYKSSILGLIKDKYNNLYVKYLKLNPYSIHQSYGLIKINDNMNIKSVKITTGDNYADLIFITSKNEIAMINAEATEGNQMYIIDSNGEPVKDSSYDGKSYYTPGSVNKLEGIWRCSDGTYFYKRYLQLYKKTETDEIWIDSIDQVLGDANGGLFYTDYSNVYIYDKQLPKITFISPAYNQNKVSPTSKIALQLSEPVKKDKDFSNISLSVNGSKASVTCTLTNNKIVITPKTKLKSKVKYTVIIPAKAVRDVAGNTLSSSYSYTFTTQ
jgi:hypothetical protein